MVYKLKVYRLPVGTPQARGKALVNLLPLQEGEWITTFMPLPEVEATWDRMFVVFATAAGHVRRNKLFDFVRVMTTGKIDMQLEKGVEKGSESRRARVCNDVSIAADAEWLNKKKKYK